MLGPVILINYILFTGPTDGVRVADQVTNSDIKDAEDDLNYDSPRAVAALRQVYIDVTT